MAQARMASLVFAKPWSAVPLSLWRKRSNVAQGLWSWLSPGGGRAERRIDMPAQLILEFDGVTEKEYEATNKALGIDMNTGEGDWPDGLITHAAGLAEDGRFVVMEVWDTPQHQERFMEGRLGEALTKGGIAGPPSSITWIELVAHHQPRLGEG